MDHPKGKEVLESKQIKMKTDKSKKIVSDKSRAIEAEEEKKTCLMTFRKKVYLGDIFSLVDGLAFRPCIWQHCMVRQKLLENY